MAGENVPNREESPSKKRSKGKHTKKRFQLFDPSSKSELLSICGNGLQELKFEEDKGEEEDDKTKSLNFEEDSSDDELESLLSGRKKDARQVPASGLVCGSCQVKFADIAEQRLHNTLDWHRYNVKRKLQGQSSVGEGKFDEMLDDLSSIDGSDDEDEVTASNGQHVDRLLEKLNVTDGSVTTGSDTVRLSKSQKLEKSPKVFLRNSKGQILSCYKVLLSEDASKFPKIIQDPFRITVIMASGGHFAAAVFDGNQCTHHKTFHSYTVRAKQGGSQGSHDSKSGTSNAKSAGASLRRYNQQSFTQHVQDLLTSWKTSISSSDLVFFKAVSANANILFTGKNPPLSKDSKNLRTVPFPTKRPTFSEIKRVHSLLTTVHLYDTMESFLAAHCHLKQEDRGKSPVKSNTKKAIDRAKSRSPKRRDDIELRNPSDTESVEEIESQGLVESDLVVDFSELKEHDDSLTPEERQRRQKKKKPKKPVVFRPEGILGDIMDALTESKLELVQSLLNQVKESGHLDTLLQPVDIQNSTVLHLAAKQNLLEIVWELLELGCDPAVRDKSGKVPYNYAESKEGREVFRKFMGEFPHKYDYKKAQVPPPLSEEMEKERAEKKKALNKLKREKEKLKKAEKKQKEKETEEQRRFLNLSDREKRALAAEQRIMAQCRRNAEKVPVMVRCFDCAADITGKVPFEYNNNLFCTSKCLAAHRKKFPVPLSVG